jgi:putative spermidine/putrescine transport system ATP-binding protein
MSSTAADMPPQPRDDEGGGERVALRLDKVAKRFDEVVALHDTSLAIRRGELITLLGPSGCGKTTLLNLISGFFSPDHGRILIDGALINEVPPYKREIGMMFQSYALFPHMSVAANVAYGLKMRRLPKRDIARRVREVLTLVKLAGLEERRPRQLSGGQQQRVALARSLVINPKILLLDEPFSALDKNLRGSMQMELREIQRSLGVTTIFVTHDQSEALSLSDRIAIMSEGRIRQVGTPEEVYANPCERFVASFVGDANVLRARLERIDGAKATVELGAARIIVPTAPLQGITAPALVDLFVRPEQIRLTEAGEACATSGTIVARVYQGGHLDLYVECPASAQGGVLVRLSGPQAMKSWLLGAQVGIMVEQAGIAFAVA